MSSTGTDTLNALSIDLEDWFHIVGASDLEATDRWTVLPSIVEAQTDRLLGACAEIGVRATFFVLGWIAWRHPRVVARVAAAGHEIACHGHWHRPVFTLRPDAFAADLSEAVAAIGGACGRRPIGYRAPSFSITPGTEWALDALIDAGFTYDASLFPARRRHGGYPCPPAPHVLAAPSGRGIAELPMSVLALGPARVPFSGGGYFRLAPQALIAHGARRLNRGGVPVVVYLHPRDITADWPWRQLPRGRRWMGRVGVHGALGKLRRLAADHRFATCAELLAERRLIA